MEERNYNYNEKLRERKQRLREIANQYIYYGIIFALSLIMLMVFPFLGSSLGLQWNIPDTVAGWVVFITTSVCQSLCNVLIFVCFIRQARLNSQDHPNFIEANEIMIKKVRKQKKPKSPEQFLSTTYISKGSMVAIGTFLGFIGLSSALLVFDVVTFIAALITVVIAIVFGIISMKKVELYWQFDYLEYAKYSEAQHELVKAQSIDNVSKEKTNENNMEEVSFEQELSCIEQRTSQEGVNEESVVTEN